MYICICNAITEKQFKQALQSGKTSVDEICRQLGVGNDCGSCLGPALKMLKSQSIPHNSSCCGGPMAQDHLQKPKE